MSFPRLSNRSAFCNSGFGNRRSAFFVFQRQTFKTKGPDSFYKARNMCNKPPLHGPVNGLTAATA